MFADNENTYPLQSLNLSKVPDRVPTVALTNYASLNPGAPWSNYQTIYELRDTFTWIKGVHTIKTGFNYSNEIKFEPTNTNVFGAFSSTAASRGSLARHRVVTRLPTCCWAARHLTTKPIPWRSTTTAATSKGKCLWTTAGR